MFQNHWTLASVLILGVSRSFGKWVTESVIPAYFLFDPLFSDSVWYEHVPSHSPDNMEWIYPPYSVLWKT